MMVQLLSSLSVHLIYEVHVQGNRQQPLTTVVEGDLDKGDCVEVADVPTFSQELEWDRLMPRFDLLEKLVSEVRGLV